MTLSLIELLIAPKKQKDRVTLLQRIAGKDYIPIILEEQEMKDHQLNIEQETSYGPNDWMFNSSI